MDWIQDGSGRGATRWTLKRMKRDYGEIGERQSACTRGNEYGLSWRSQAVFWINRRAVFETSFVDKRRGGAQGRERET